MAVASARAIRLFAPRRVPRPHRSTDTALVLGTNRVRTGPQILYGLTNSPVVFSCPYRCLYATFLPAMSW
jgi:hypothetical protein